MATTLAGTEAHIAPFFWLACSQFLGDLIPCKKEPLGRYGDPNVWWLKPNVCSFFSNCLLVKPPTFSLILHRYPDSSWFIHVFRADFPTILADLFSHERREQTDTNGVLEPPKLRWEREIPRRREVLPAVAPIDDFVISEIENRREKSWKINPKIGNWEDDVDFFHHILTISSHFYDIAIKTNKCR